MPYDPSKTCIQLSPQTRNRLLLYKGVLELRSYEDLIIALLEFGPVLIYKKKKLLMEELDKAEIIAKNLIQGHISVETPPLLEQDNLEQQEDD